MNEIVRVRLGKRELEAVEWAIGAMEGFATEEDCDYKEEDVPRVNGNFLVIPGTSLRDNAIEDLIYRIEEQLPDVAEGADYNEEKDAKAVVCAGKRFAGKLRREVYRSRLQGHAPGPRGSSGHELAEGPDGPGADEKRAEVE